MSRCAATAFAAHVAMTARRAISSSASRKKGGSSSSKPHKAETKPSKSDGASLSRSAKASRPLRPVFLPAAFRRMFRQRTWRQRFRSLQVIASFILSDAAWWLRAGLWYVPRTLRDARKRTSLPIHRDIPSPSVDVYAPPEHDKYLRARLQTLSCAPPSHQPEQQPSTPQTPVVLYVHGGAWGAGDASHYSQLATSLTELAGATVLVLSYRLYPAARMEHQVADVAAGLRFARRLFPGRPLTVLAHSSGAHLTALALLRAAEQGTEPLADVLITTAGPFHLMHHFLFEAGRGVADVSPMLPAASAECDPEEFDRCSPTCAVEAFGGTLEEVEGLPRAPEALEGELAAANVYLPKVGRDKRCDVKARFPRTYVMTSSCDTIVPMYSSLRFAAALRTVGLESSLLVYDFAGHVDFVTDWFAGAQDRNLSDVLDVCEDDRERRVTYVGLLKGKKMAELAGEESGNLGPTPYVRDVVRILNSLTASPELDEDDIV